MTEYLNITKLDEKSLELVLPNSNGQKVIITADTNSRLCYNTIRDYFEDNLGHNDEIDELKSTVSDLEDALESKEKWDDDYEEKYESLKSEVDDLYHRTSRDLETIDDYKDELENIKNDIHNIWRCS